MTFLTESGFEAVHWSDVGAEDASDSDLMRWAAGRGYVVLTADLDFAAILAATKNERPSIIQVRSDVLTPRSMGRAVVSAMRQARQELLEGAIVSVDPAPARLRVLPLKD